MELRIRQIFKPFAMVAALLLNKTKLSMKATFLYSLLITILGVASFYFLYEDPWNYGLMLLSIALVFLNAFSDELSREFSKLKKLSELEKVGLRLHGYADVLLIFAALYYLSLGEYDLGVVKFMKLNEYLALGVAVFLGIYLMSRTSKRKANPWLEARSERMFFLTAFMIAGYTHGTFPEYLFVGIISLGGILYLGLIHGAYKSYVHEHAIGYDIWKLTRPIKYLSMEFVDFLTRLTRIILGATSRLQRTAEESTEEEVAQEDEQPMSGHNFTALVTDGTSSQPVAHAKVILKNTDSNKKIVRYTDSSGKSNFSNVVEGQYNISIQVEGFKKEEYERYLSMDSGESFTLSKHSSDLSVVVTDSERRNPIGRATVTLAFEGNEYASRTDNLGVAYFGELEIAPYDITVDAEGYQTSKGKINLAEENLKAIELERITPGMEMDRQEEPSMEERRVEKTGEEDESAKDKDKAKQRITQVLGESALVEYTASSKVEDGIAKIMGECLNNDRDVFLVSSPPRTEIYKAKFKEEIQQGKVKLINLAAIGSPSETGDIPMTDLKQFKAVFEEMSAGSVMIFEALSNLILSAGGVSAYKFISETVEHFSTEGLCVVCFLSKEAHEARETSSFKNLFVNLVKMEGDKFSLGT
ncbi:MAG: carboxypeptidase-like regulatory domain-containing protein [Candidatus Hydrothermarchaeales archaeon]